MKTRVTVVICLAVLLNACLVELPDPAKDLDLQLNSVSLTNNGIYISASAGRSAYVSEFGVEVSEDVVFSTTEYSNVIKIKSSSLTSFDSILRVPFQYGDAIVTAYAVTGNDRIYSQQKKLSIKPYWPVIHTSPTYLRTHNTLVVSATISDDKGFPVTERGFCWKKYDPFSTTATISDNKIVVGSGIGTFSDTIKGLSPDTRYSVCAYATNGAGTKYAGAGYITALEVVGTPSPKYTISFLPE